MTASLMFVIASAGMAAANPAAAPIAHSGGAVQVAHFDAASGHSLAAGSQVISGVNLTPKAAPANTGGAGKPGPGPGGAPKKIPQRRPVPPPPAATR